MGYDAFSYLLLAGAILAIVAIVVVVILFLNDVNRGPSLPNNPVHQDWRDLRANRRNL